MLSAICLSLAFVGALAALILILREHFIACGLRATDVVAPTSRPSTTG